MHNQSAPVIYSVTNLLWGDTFTGVTLWIVSAIWDRAITLSQKKWVVLFWMCNFIDLTRCCKLISFLHLIFAVLLPNLITPIVCQKYFKGHVTKTRPFSGKFLPRPLGFPKTKLCTKFEVPIAQAVLKICLIVCQKFRGCSHAPLGKVIYASARHSTC